MTVEDCRAFVESSEKHKKHCVIPDFTRWRWKTTAPLGIIHM